MRSFMSLCLCMIICVTAKANGIAVVDVSEGLYLNLITSSVEVSIDNQVARV